MKFEQLYLFKEAVKYNSISVAAEKNFMSQSSVSYSIINLEKELGTELLRRTNAGVTPTFTGELVLLKTEDILKAVDDITELTSSGHSGGEVSFSCIPCICDWIVPGTLQSLERDNILLSVITGESSQVARDVSAGISRFGILINYGELGRSTDLHYTPLFQDEYMLYIGRNSPFWERETMTWKELLGEPYIAYRDEFKKYNGGLTNLVGTEELPRIVFRTDSLDSIKSMIAQGNYTAFFPKYMSSGDFYIQSGLIRSIPISDRSLGFEVGYVKSTKYKMKKLDRTVLNRIKATLQERNP